MTALVLFTLTYCGIAFGRLPGLALDRTGIALLGAIAMVVAGVPPARDPDAAPRRVTRPDQPSGWSRRSSFQARNRSWTVPLGPAPDPVPSACRRKVTGASRASTRASSSQAT